METFNTCYSTPYGALGLDLSKNYNDRTAIQNFKTAFSFASLMIPSLLMGVCLSDFTNTRGYLDIAMVTSVLCVLCAVVCVFGTLRHKNASAACPPQIRRKRSFRESWNLNEIFDDFFGIIRQKNVGRLIAGYAVSLSAGAFLTSLGLHVFTYTFHFSTAQIPIIMLCLIAGIIAGQPLWYFISRRTDKITSLVSALGTLVVCMTVFSSVLIFRSQIPVDFVLIYVCAAIFASGIATGCLYSLPISMFADCIALNNSAQECDKTGKSAGFLTFCTKISNAVILFVIGLSLDIIGFSGASQIQPLAVQNWLGWLLVAGVTTASITAILIYSKYSYKKSDFTA
jgi:Na+/melibiose symporter-like transporter